MRLFKQLLMGSAPQQHRSKQMNQKQKKVKVPLPESWDNDIEEIALSLPVQDVSEESMVLPMPLFSAPKYTITQSVASQLMLAESNDNYSHDENDCTEVKHRARKEKCSQVDSDGKKSSGHKKNTPTSKPSSSTQEASTSDEELIKQFESLNRRCAFSACKEVITMIYSDCKLCCNRYCIPHSLPEVHGCGTEAKRAARKGFVHPPPKELNPKAKIDLKKKLAQKLSALSKDRKGGKPK